MPASDSSRSDDRRALHDDKAGELQMVDQGFAMDLGHDFAGVVDPLATFEPEREGMRVR
jgi:hypothetical protein